MNPILHTPYQKPVSHWRLDGNGRTTDNITSGRRPSEALAGIPGESISCGGPDTMPHSIINGLRRKVGEWREAGWPGATSRTRRLLEFWAADSGAPMRPFWCQREAIETVVWLLEAGPTHDPHYHGMVASQIDGMNDTYNDGIPRMAFKMATGTGKTHLMAMMALWHTTNTPGYGTVDFLAISPNRTVRRRLKSLVSSKDPLWQSITPPGFRRELDRMKWTVLNFQAFQRRSILGIDGEEKADSKVKRLLRAGRPEPSGWTESEHTMLERLLKDNSRNGKLVIMNDEAHHCYRRNFVRGATVEEKRDLEHAELWFGALRALRDAGRLERVFDFSATPMWLRRPRELDSEIFPWTVSDFSLLDAIESGLVKIPRVPVGDDTDSGQPRYRNVYEYNDGKDLGVPLSPRVRDPLEQLYRNYAKETYPLYTKAGVMPVFIVVANKISNAEAIYRHIAGTWDGDMGKPGHLEMFSNFNPDGTAKAHPPTLLVHSQLDRPVGTDASVIDRHAKPFLRDMSVSDRLEAIRDIFDTVGRRGKPGEWIRCVVSVGMLTEGWDARNVTHIFGYRRFGSLLLCEQVTGRALRRTSFSGYDDRQSPEYANVFGVPYTFARGEDETIQVPVQPYLVESLPERAPYRMNLPNVVGYDSPGGTMRFRLDASEVEPYMVVRSAPRTTQLQGAVGSEDRTVAHRRYRTAMWETAAAVSRYLDFTGDSGDDSHVRKRIIFADAVSATKSWLEHPRISCDFPEELQFDDVVPAKIAKACRLYADGQAGPLPIFADMRDRGLPRLLSTGDVRFETTLKHRCDTVRSELNAAACHSHSEVQLAGILDGHRLVQCWVRNFRLGFTVPWFDAETHTWRVTEPDFVARVARPNSAVPLHLLIEFKGKRRGDSREVQKRIYLEKWWAPAVSAWGEYGEWRVVWIEDIRDAAQRLDEACAGES